MFFSLAMACVSAGISTHTIGAQSPNVPAEERKGFDAISQAQLRSDVAFLASDRLEGRLSLQPGDETAVQWIAGQFGKAGLDPIATKPNGMPSYEQGFDIIEYRPDRVNSAVTLVHGGRSTVWHAPDAFGAYKHPVNLTAPVVFAGYGITAPELNYDDYKDLNVKGKIVLIFDHEPQEDDPQSVFNGTGNTRYATTRVKLLNAQEHGAVAVVIVAEPNRKHLTNAERSARIGGSITRPTPLALQAIEEDELKIPSVTVLDAVAKEILAAAPTSATDLQTKIDADLTPQSMALPDTTLTLHLRNLSESTGRTANVLGLLRGSDPNLKAETIIISAHHDHDGMASCPPGQEGTNQDGQSIPHGMDCVQTWHGADDNASGTAGVVALARAFTADGVKPKRSILFVVFAAEERGLLGSYWMAAHPLRPLSTTRAMINFDMIGRDEKPSPQTEGLIDIPADTSNRLNLIGALYSPDYKRVVVEANNSVGLTLDDRFDRDAALNVLFRSDQFPFLLHNIPAFWWFTGFHPDYHHITDTAEKIDYPKMAKILQLAYLSAWRFATDDAVPKFVANPEPPPPAAPVSADAPASDAPAEPVHHRPITPVTIVPTTGAAGEEIRPVAAPEVSAPVAPAPAKAAKIKKGDKAAKSTAASPDTAAPAPLAPPVAVPAPAAATAAPSPATSPASMTAASAASTTAATPPKRRRPITPVVIQPTTGEDSVVKQNPTDPEATATPTATTTSASGASVVQKPSLTNQPAKGKGAPPPVTPVKLGGKLPGQDEYEDDPPSTPAPPK
jgi:hypothetical protein